MKKFVLLWVMAMLSMASDAQRAFELKNSDDGQSVLKVFLPAADAATGRAVVCCPGGGYSVVCMDYEGTDWAPYFNNMGIAYAVVKYRMPKGDRAIPIGDAERAIRTMRDSAQAWHINVQDVGIMGFSAGGHLASTVATHADYKARPNFQILFYPVISIDKTKGHRGSSENFLGKDVDNKDLIKAFSNELQVKRHITGPAILFMADDDLVVPPLTNGVPYYTALRQNNIPASLHIYPSGGHGWKFDERFRYHREMLNTLTDWLKQLKAPREEAVKVACVGNSITDGYGIALAQRDGYPAQLQRMLGNGYQVRNFGVSARTLLNNGDIPYMKEYAWKDCKEWQPDVVIIKLGTNDSKEHNWVHKDEYMGDMQQMIDELRALPSKPRIILGYPTKAWRDQWTIRDSIIVNDIIPMIDKMAKKNKLETVDFHTPLSAPECEQLFQRDAIHPTAKGATVLARTAKDAILKTKK